MKTSPIKLFQDEKWPGTMQRTAMDDRGKIWRVIEHNGCIRKPHPCFSGKLHLLDAKGKVEKTVYINPLMSHSL